MMGRLAALLLVFGIASCGPALYRWDGTSPPERNAREDRSYTVQKGDTLYSIAFRYGLDYRRLAEWNGISSSYLIHPGDRLDLVPPGETTSTEPLPGPEVTPLARRVSPDDGSGVPETLSGDWRWPHGGSLLARFGQDKGTGGKGIDIEGIVGDGVHAAAAGRVVYAGSGLVGYGKIIIVKHSEKFLSAYAHNSELYVREGEQVEQGERIAAMGRGPGNIPLLHFEIRVNGNAVDPLKYLPDR